MGLFTMGHPIPREGRLNMTRAFGVNVYRPDNTADQIAVMQEFLLHILRATELVRNNRNLWAENVLFEHYLTETLDFQNAADRYLDIFTQPQPTSDEEDELNDEDTDR